MSKRQFKSQASSGRVPSAFGGFGASGFGSSQSSVLSYIQEPPDFSGIHDSNVVVAFKNLSKKDATTKAKALEDLQAHINTPDVEVEDGFLEAWVKLFPRLSIDSARRVRQLSHNLNGLVCSRCGKRTAKHLPRIAGPWLAGTYDSDRAASKAAQDALRLVFSSPEKVHGLRKAFHQSILEYCKDAVQNETVQTLSDERAVSADDAEATYARVVATCLAVVTSLIQDLASEDLDQQQHSYEHLFEGRVWDFASHSDSNVRKSVHRLVRTCLAKLPEPIRVNLKGISTAYIYKGLPSDQTGSSLDFVQTLDSLTVQHPSIWTEHYGGKKSAVSRLRSCLKHGSRSGPAEFWPALANLIHRIPDEIMPTEYEDVANLLTAARDGVSKKEDRFNASYSWQAYVSITDVVSQNLTEEDQGKIMDQYVMPIIRQYLLPSPETSEWAISGAKPAMIVAKAAQVQRLPSALQQELPLLADQMIDQIKLSQPEQSKDYDRSQKEVTAAGTRWSALQRELSQSSIDLPDTFTAAFVAQDKKLIQECFSLLASRNGKPYGAAATVDELLRACGELLMNDGETKSMLASFAQDDLPRLLFTASQKHLTHCLYALNAEPSFDTILDSVLERIAEDDAKAASKEQLLRALFTRQTPKPAAKRAVGSNKLQKVLLELCTPDGDGKIACTGLLAELLPSNVVAPETVATTLGSLNRSLAGVSSSSDALLSLDYLAGPSQGVLTQYMTDSEHGGDQLLSNLLRLEQANDTQMSELANKLSSKLSISDAGNAAIDKFSVVRQNLESTNNNPITMESLFDLTIRLLGPDRKVEEFAKVMPDLGIWTSSLLATMSKPKTSLSVLSPFGSAVSLVSGSDPAAAQARYDSQGLSQPLRIAMYMSKLFSSTDIFDALKISQDKILARIVILLTMTVLVAEDNMSIPGTSPIWLSDPEQDAEVLDFISEANGSISNILTGFGPVGLHECQTAIAELAPQSANTLSVASYYANLASARIASNWFEAHGSPSDTNTTSEETLRKLRKQGDLFSLLGHIVGHSNPLAGTQYLNRVCNELVADLTGVQLEGNGEKAFRELITLNVILASQEDMVAAIAKQRLIFLVKHIIQWLETSANTSVRTESIKVLTFLLPGMFDIYGEHWAQILTLLASTWGQQSLDNMDDANIASLNGSLRLFGAIKKISRSEDANDDLADALKEQGESIFEGLLRLLKSGNGMSDESHQPLMLTNELLARNISQLSAKLTEDANDLYPLLYAQSRAIQQAAFDLLHAAIPPAQEKISFDAALDKKSAHLPDELLSLILDAPTLDDLATASFDRTMPLSLQSYLYSWRLLFDHFPTASYKVKSDYILQLQDGPYLPGLLNLAFDFLGHSRGKPVDASRFATPIADYVPGVEESPEREVQALLTHLFYLSLTHLPSLTKSHFLSLRSRQTSIALESWTAKHISPPIIAASLQSVSDWADKTQKEDPDENMGVKVGWRSREVHVSYIVDEQTMAIKVALPEAYPLASAQVVGVSRVAVKEEKWQSWLRNCQGVITFSNGSLPDGLTAWRKNVTGALKGQTECAICYSIISGDKQLPTKRCPTCKNLFHASCLFKWFKTSNASTCPLCRNAFNFN